MSPALAELEPHLEGALHEKWADPESGEFGGGWFVFALIEAAERCGYYGSAREADAFHRRLADEVNAACADGRVECTGPRATFRPVWHSDYLGPGAAAWLRAWVYMVRFTDFEAEPSPSEAAPGLLGRYELLTHNRVQ